MRHSRLAALLTAMLVSVAVGSCGGGGDDDAGPMATRVAVSREFAEVGEALAAAIEDDRDVRVEIIPADTDELVDVAADGGADAVVTAGEDAMEALAAAGVVRNGSWNRVTTKDGVEYWSASTVDAEDPDGALQWVSFMGGAGPWDTFEQHGFSSPLSED